MNTVFVVFLLIVGATATNNTYQNYVDYVTLRNSDSTCSNFLDSISMYCFVLSLPNVYHKYLVTPDDFTQCSQLLNLCNNDTTIYTNNSQCSYMNQTDVEEFTLLNNKTYLNVPDEYAFVYD